MPNRSGLMDFALSVKHEINQTDHGLLDGCSLDWWSSPHAQSERKIPFVKQD